MTASYVEKSMTGKTCLVTGATSGIGMVTARCLAELGADVVVTGRSAEKSTQAAAQIKRSSDNASVDWLAADLSSQREVRELAQEFKRRYATLHVLVNNAGAMFPKRLTSSDGIEMTFAVNYLSHFLLTNLLLDTIRASAPARIINVCSVAHEGATIDFDDLQYQRGYRSFRAYSRSKLALLLFTYELSRRLQGTGVSVNAVHPGLVWTDLGQRNGWTSWLGQKVVHLRYRRYSVGPEEGARTSVYLASSPTVEHVTGQYFDSEQAVPSSEQSYDTALAQRLWDVSAEFVGLVDKVG